jgi:hypothetical protein
VRIDHQPVILLTAHGLRAGEKFLVVLAQQVPGYSPYLNPTGLKYDPSGQDSEAPRATGSGTSTRSSCSAGRGKPSQTHVGGVSSPESLAPLSVNPFGDKTHRYESDEEIPVTGENDGNLFDDDGNPFHDHFTTEH